MPVDLDKWARGQVDALVALGDDAIDAERYIKAVLSWLPEGADPSTFVPTEEQLDSIGVVDEAAVGDARVVWFSANWVSGKFKRLLDARSPVREFDPDQARDESGKWTSGGGGSYASAKEKKGVPPAIEVDEMGEEWRLKRGMGDTDKLVGLMAQSIAPGVRKVPKDPMMVVSVMIKTSNAKLAEIKAQGCVTFSEATGLSSDTVRAFQDSWATTSGDEHETSVMLQNQAAHLFEVDGGYYSDDKVIQASLAQGQYGPSPGKSDEIRTYLAAVYDKTQNDLAAAGIENVILYRGMGTDGFGELGRADPGEIVTHTSNPLSSWSLSREIGSVFAKTHAYGQHGIVLAMTVPRERIFSTASNGLGCYGEAEVILIGGVKDEAVILEDIR